MSCTAGFTLNSEGTQRSIKITNYLKEKIASVIYFYWIGLCTYNMYVYIVRVRM